MDRRGAGAIVTKISVYIPAYNVGEFLARSIESLQAQTIPPDEILVIDDGSRDNSAEIASAYHGRHADPPSREQRPGSRAQYRHARRA